MSGNDIVTLTKKANKCKKRKPMEALRLFKMAYELDSTNVYVLVGLTQVYLKLYKLDEALEFARECIKLPNSLAGLGLLVKVLLARREIEEAEQVAKKRLKEAYDSNGLGSLTQAFLAGGKFVEAEETAREHLQEFGNAVSFGLLTQILMASGKLNEAEKVARERLKVLYDGSGLGLLVQVLSVIGKLEEAEEYARRRLREFYNSIGLVSLIEILRKRHKYEEAVSYIEYAKKDIGTNYILLNCAGYCYMHLKDYDKALEHFCDALKFCKGNLSTSIVDEKLRGYVGIIFLNSYSDNVPILTLSEAVEHLILAKETDLGKHQIKEYNSAMEIIEKNNLRELLC